jgi:hypothetical protein
MMMMMTQQMRMKYEQRRNKRKPGLTQTYHSLARGVHLELDIPFRTRPRGQYEDVVRARVAVASINAASLAGRSHA